ncbi:MAG TPA: MBL fold metallo-hydrolase [Gammaproteobacteria bacterium]|nr:MBL fold metallo-hydrolase [Gammaproteobacteria bacterium]
MNRHLRSALFLIPVAVLAQAALGQGQVDFSAVQIKVHHVNGNVYYLEGQGGNVGLLVGNDGVIMIDDQFAPLTEKLVAAIRTLSDKPIRFVINTHIHGDHTGGNENLGKMGIAIMAHDNVAVRLAAGVNGGAPAPVAARPVFTYSDAVALHLNGENLSVMKVPAAHTDGDSYIRFEGANVIHLGDVFRTTGYPVVDANNGGTVKGTLEALQIAIDMAGPDTKLIPGHGVVSDRDDMIEFRDMIIDVQKRVSDLIRQGMTVEQVVAAKPTADLDARWGSPERFLPGFYQALKGEM